MGTYKSVQCRLLDRRKLGAWIGRRIVAYCPTTRAAMRESGLPSRVFYDLWKPRRARPRVRMAIETFHGLFGAAVRLAQAAKKSGPQLNELVPHVLKPPAEGLFSGRRKALSAPAPRGGEVHDYEQDARRLRERGDWTEAGIVELRGKTVSTELRPGDFYRVTSGVAEQQLIRRYGKRSLRWLRAAGKRYVALVTLPDSPLLKKRGRPRKR